MTSGNAASIAAAALAAAAAAPPDGHGPPDLTAVADAVATAAGARWCVLVAGSRDHVSGEPPELPDAAGDVPGARRGGPEPVEVTFRGGAVGSLWLDAPAAVTRDVAVALGPVFANAATARRLHELRRSAQRSVGEITDARWRAAAEMDTERRELERDLHDGAQGDLVALRTTIALLEHALDGGGDAQLWLDRLADQLDTAERTLARTAAGVLPVTLVRSGLVAALAAEVGAGSLAAAGVGDRRYPAAVESAVWFTCLEAINNARKHAPGATITVTLRATVRGLAFAVADDGPGFEVGPSESGLHHMRARVETVGGTAEVRSAPGAGTTVEGFVPI